MKFRRRNLQNIKGIFEEKTGTDLHRKPAGFPMRKVAVLAAVIVCCLALTAFTYPLFTPLDGDELSLSGTYEGNGIVSVYVENGSKKDLKFQEQLKLMNWFTGEEAPKLEGDAVFSGTKIPAGSSGVMTIDLSKAYDVEYLEHDVANSWYYLVLTNHDFVFGHDWMCSVYFNETTQNETEKEETAPAMAAENIERVEAELRFYFAEAYDEVLAFNEANFVYQQKVEEVLQRFRGNVVSSLSPKIMVSGTSEYLNPQPVLKDIPAGVILDETVSAEKQDLLTSSDWEYVDGYGRMVASRDEKAWTLGTVLPAREGETDGCMSIPLIFLFVYDADAASDPGSYAFIYGQFLSFEEMAQYLVFADEQYAIYDATDLIYTDLERYLDDFIGMGNSVYCDEQVRQRVRNVYAYYRENLADLIGYWEKE